MAKIEIRKELEFECEKHGNIGNNTMAFMFFSNPGLNKRFCLVCYMEKMIEIGVKEATEIVNPYAT